MELPKKLQYYDSGVAFEGASDPTASPWMPCDFIGNFHKVEMMLVPSKETPIAAPNGSFCFGDIPHVSGAGSTVLCNAGKVILPFGDISFGYTHIQRKHGDKIKHYYKNVERYIQIAASGYQKIYLEKDGRLWLLKFNGVVKTVVIAEYSVGPLAGISSAQYKVITGYPLVRLPEFEKRGARILWER